MTRAGVRAPEAPAPARPAAADVLLATVPFGFLLVGYAVAAWVTAGMSGDYVQGATNHLGFALHVVEPVRLDRWLFGQLPTSWLQERLYVPGRAHWYDAGVALVYATHYLAGPAVAAVLWFQDRRRFTAWVSCVLTTAALGLVTYVVYPMAPPWLASEQGLTEPISRISNLGWEYLHLDVIVSVVHGGQSVSNPVAAMPSLHVAFATLCAAFFVAGAPRWRQLLLVAYPTAMAFAVVYSGEHYVADVLAGAAYALVVVAAVRVAASALARRPSLRAEGRAEPSRP